MPVQVCIAPTQTLVVRHGQITEQRLGVGDGVFGERVARHGTAGADEV
jgi:hypothetical protein